VITQCIEELVDFYPKHIEKEDKHFFIPIMEYFNTAEKDAMLEEGYEFDQKSIHENTPVSSVKQRRQGFILGKTDVPIEE